MDNIDIFIINHNGENVLLETIQSLKDQDYPAKTITLIDDGSTDKSITRAQKYFPSIGIIGMGYNSKRLNKLRRLAISNTQSRYTFIIDNDIILERDCLTNLIETMKANQQIGICTPRLMYYTNRKKINICWTKLHYLCNSISPIRDTYTPPESEPQDTVGGGIMLIDKNKIETIGNIDDSLPMGWGDDAEIYIRMKIAGYRTVYVPQAIGYHHVKEWQKSRSYRALGQIYNRWAIILSMYQMKTIIFLFPAFFIYEIFLFLMLTSKRLSGSYFSALGSLIKNSFSILKKRSFIQATRKVKDKTFLTDGPLYIPPAHLSNPIYKLGINYLNKMFSVYWQLIKNLL